MNTNDLLATLGGRQPPGAPEVVSVAICGPIEVALARDGSDAGLRRAWRQRQKGRPTPLLTVHDAATAGVVRVLGPTDERAPIRQVPADLLADLLQRTSTMSRLLAAREISEELQRLDEGGIPGVVVKGLLTRHLVQVRLRLMDQWAGMQKAAKDLPASPDWRALLSGLGFSLERRKQRGWLARSAGAPVPRTPGRSARAAISRSSTSSSTATSVSARTAGITSG